MSLFVHALRFVVGMALVVAGAVLAQPFASAVYHARQQAAAAGHDGPVPLQLPRAAVPAGMSPAQAGDGQVMSWPPGPGVLAATGPQVGPGPWGVPVEGGRFDVGGGPMPPPPRMPPAPPTPLPRSQSEFAPSPPVMDGAYRSTLDIPPPPLLDTQSPPPLSVGWSTHDVARPAAAAADSVELPASYVVRDGDDLTGIALKIYGSAGAANAIWAANRDRLRDPQLLPIGVVLRMPPSWTLPSAHAAQAAAGGHAIEPAFGGASTTSSMVPTGPASWRTARPKAAEQRPSGSSIWLQPGDGEGPRAPAAASSQQPRGVPPATVRVAEGDSLESIAVRFYGDRTAAAQIWQANRDRLRSPDLLVAGTELRLP